MRILSSDKYRSEQGKEWRMEKERVKRSQGEEKRTLRTNVTVHEKKCTIVLDGHTLPLPSKTVLVLLFTTSQSTLIENF